MKLNTLKPAPGSKRERVRVGRGIGSTLGKTCGKGHKGMKARSGATHCRVFAGGQMPLHRRLPKFGFASRIALVSESLPVSVLNSFTDGELVTVASLIEKDLIPQTIKNVKFYASGELTVKVNLKGVKVTQSTRALIESRGGSVE
jgi:large subunit ribosomal protein L15